MVEFFEFMIRSDSIVVKSEHKNKGTKLERITITNNKALCVKFRNNKYYTY